MRAAPKLTTAIRYPVIAGTALLALGVTLAWWARVDISPLFEDAMIRRGELWRLFSSIFPHGGVVHLAFNLYWIWVFGTLVEETYGHAKTAALILLFAVVPNAFEFAFADGGIGLSGVGYGLFGLLWVLSKRDARFHDAVDSRTVQLFVGWFFICILTTVTKIMPVANIAHGVGAVVGILTGFVLTDPKRRALIVSALGLLLFAGLWGSTSGRPKINLSQSGGYDEGHRGYEALVANRNEEAVRWFRDAVVYQPKVGGYWYDLGLAYQRLGDKKAAVAAYRAAAQLGEPAAQYYLGTLYRNGELDVPKDIQEALRWYLKSASQQNTDALNDLAWEYATSDDPSFRNPALALEYARKFAALEKDKPNPAHLDTLAEAYYVNGLYSDAVDVEQKAIALATSDNKDDFQQRLKKYERALAGKKDLLLKN